MSYVSKNLQGSINKAFSIESEANATLDRKEHDKEGTQAKLEDDNVDTAFGIGPCKSPRMGKYFSNLYIFSILTGSAAMLSAAGPKSFSLQLQSLKTQFHFQDDDVADMQVAYCVAIVVSSAVLGFLGNYERFSIPLVLSIASFLNGLALMVPSFFYFTRPYHLHVNASEQNLALIPFLCVQNRTGFDMSQPKVDKTAYLVLISSQTLCGLFLPVLSVLAIVYIDNNLVQKWRLGLFMGIFTCIYESASVSASTINGFFRKMAIDLSGTELDPMDSRFVAAWWLPLLLLGGSMCLIAFNLIQFPRKLLSEKRQQEALVEAVILFSGELSSIKKEQEGMWSSGTLHTSDSLKIDVSTPVQKGTVFSQVPAQKQETSYEQTSRPPVQSKDRQGGNRVTDAVADDVRGIKGILVQLYRNFKNPIFLLILINVAFFALPMKGPEMFRPLYQMHEFSLSMATISNAGMAYTVTNFVGIIVGACISYKIRSLKGYALLMLVAYGLCSIISPLYLAFGCDNQLLYGYDGKHGKPLPGVQENCSCLPGMALPVCAEDSHSYYSPCFAGCRAGNGITFSNCSLTKGSNANSAVCDAGCTRQFAGYVVVFSLLTFLLQMAVLPRTLMLLRMMAPKDRAFAISMFHFFFYLLSIPAPKVFGQIFEDIGCYFFTSNVCQQYDQKKIRYLLSGLEVGISISLFITALLVVLILTMIDDKMKLNNKLKDKDKSTAGL